jgi:hypothetical protein
MVQMSPVWTIPCTEVQGEARRTDLWSLEGILYKNHNFVSVLPILTPQTYCALPNSSKQYNPHVWSGYSLTQPPCLAAKPCTPSTFHVSADDGASDGKSQHPSISIPPKRPWRKRDLENQAESGYSLIHLATPAPTPIEYVLSALSMLIPNIDMF